MHSTTTIENPVKHAARFKIGSQSGLKAKAKNNTWTTRSNLPRMSTCLTSVNIAQDKEGHSETFSHKVGHLDQLMYIYEWSVLYVLVVLKILTSRTWLKQELARCLYEPVYTWMSGFKPCHPKDYFASWAPLDSMHEQIIKYLYTLVEYPCIKNLCGI